MDVSVQVVLTNLDLQACTFVFGKFRLKILGYSKSGNNKICFGHLLRLGDFNARSPYNRKVSYTK